MMLNRVSLNTIGLNRIGLNRIGKPFRASSDRPYIDPEVLASLKAVCICYGKSNDDPDRDVVKNLVDPDNPFVISNAAFKLNSGFGEYKVDFTTWSKVAGTSIITDSKYILTDEKAITSGGYFLWNRLAKDSFKVKISNIPNGGWMSYRYRITEEDTQFSSLFIREDGIYTLPATIAGGDVDFFISTVSAPAKDWVGLTIEQIPSFQGAFVTDGIGDLITSTKTVQEMLGGSNEITVVSLITHISGTGKYNIIGDGGIQVSDYSGQTFMAGTSSSGEKIVELGDKEKLQAVQYTTFDSKLTIGLEDSSYAYYGTFVFNKENVPVDWIHQVIAYFNLDRTLKPDILCNTIKQGITNENHAEFGDKLIDYSGNGRDIQLSNIAWHKESGIDDNGALCLDGINDFGKVTGMPIYKDYTIIADYERISGIEQAWAEALISKSYIANQGAFVLMETNGMAKHSYSFGAYTTFNKDDSTRTLLYQSKYKCGDVDLNAGTGIDGDTLWLGTYRDNYSSFFNGAIYSLMSFPYSMSEFLIERQLKKHKLGTLYPDMVEFRPVIKANANYNLYSTYKVDDDGTWTKIQAGDNVLIGSRIALQFSFDSDADELVSATSSQLSNITVVKNNSNVGYTVFGFATNKSPQKINITIYQPPEYLTMLSNSTLISNETLIKNE